MLIGIKMLEPNFKIRNAEQDKSIVQSKHIQWHTEV